MNEVYVLVNYKHAYEVVGAFTDKALVEEYVAGLADECEYCESLEARGEKCLYHELIVWTVTLDDPSFIQPPKDNPENTNMSEVHVLSNSYGEILVAFSDNALIPEDRWHCASCESRGEICPSLELVVHTVALDSPTLIQHFKERIEKSRENAFQKKGS